MRPPFILVLLLAPTVAACGSKALGGVDCSDLVSTPGGQIAKDCVHEVPNGAVLTPGDGGVTVVSVDGAVVATYPPCPCHNQNQIGSPQCTDRMGILHVVGETWMDGCMSCSCGDLGDHTLSPICSHNTCPPDASSSD